MHQYATIGVLHQCRSVRTLRRCRWGRCLRALRIALFGTSCSIQNFNPGLFFGQVLRDRCSSYILITCTRRNATNVYRGCRLVVRILRCGREDRGSTPRSRNKIIFFLFICLGFHFLGIFAFGLSLAYISEYFRQRFGLLDVL